MDQNSQKLRTPAQTVGTEQILERYYVQLMEWASRLTRGDEAKAQDFVHDLCLHFTVSKPDLRGITNLDGYLYKCLRHIYLSGLARSSREALQFVNIADFDSIQCALTQGHTSDTLRSQNDLRRICCYSVWRKAQTKSASYFILRFFHGYHHQEIAALARSPIVAICNQLGTFRAEVCSYLAEPGKLQVIGRDVPPAPILRWAALSTIDLFRELRHTILQARTGACWSKDELVALYSRGCSKGIPCSLLSHLVSCEHCLALIDNHLGRPTLKDREPLDKISDNSYRTGSRGVKPTGISRSKLLRSVRRDTAEILEHRPRKLSIAVDGKILASHDVQAQRNVLTARIERPENTNFVEAFSELGIRLALLSINELPPEGPHEQSQRVVLSDGRWLNLSLSFDGLGLNSEVVYFDPALVSEAMEEEEGSDTTVRIFSRLQSAEGPILSFLSRSSDSALASGCESPTTWIDKFRSLVPAMNPFLASAMVLGAATVLCLILWLRSSTRLPVGELLDRAKISDRAATTSNRPGVIYQKVAIRTPRRTVERTIYRDAQGVRRPRRQQLSAEDERLRNALASSGVNWDAPLSAIDYAEWRHRSGPTRDRVTYSGRHLLTLSTTPAAEGEVLNETLTVDDTDFRAVDRTVELRDGGTVEIAELNYDVLPWGAVNQDWFEPLPAGSATDAPGALSRHPSSSQVELETELMVGYALHEVNADLGEPIEIRAGAPGTASVLVVGIVPSSARKEELLVALKGIPHVTAQLQTEEEAAQALPELPSRIARVEPLILTARSPIEKELLAYLGDPMAVENFSQRAAVLTKDLMDHAWALRHLSERYATAESPGELVLGTSSLRMLQTMRRDHIRAMSDATSELATLLRPVLQSIVETPPESTPRLALFHRAHEVQRLTLELLSGSRPADANEAEPAKAARDLLAALRGLEITLEEQQ